MLDNFRKIYNKELKLYKYEGKLTKLILNSTEVRAFVYEVCQGCVASEEKLKGIIDEILYMAIRYAHGSHSAAPSMIRNAVKTLKDLYPDFRLIEDDTIKPPTQIERINPTAVLEDWLDDLFIDGE